MLPGMMDNVLAPCPPWTWTLLYIMSLSTDATSVDIGLLAGMITNLLYWLRGRDLRLNVPERYLYRTDGSRELLRALLVLPHL
jgi:hypothetical protein